MKENVAGKLPEPATLFDIRAWNLTGPPWIPLPGEGTHQNCLAVVALREVAHSAAASLGEPIPARDTLRVAAGLDEAINRYLWNETKGAYTDACGRTGESGVAKQTQTVAYLPV